jgi:hypothetical protein
MNHKQIIFSYTLKIESMQNENLHPLFNEILHSFFPGHQSPIENSKDETIPTSIGDKTPAQILNHLGYCTYKAQRDLGMSHDRLVFHKLATDEYLIRYEEEKRREANDY